MNKKLFIKWVSLNLCLTKIKKDGKKREIKTNHHKFSNELSRIFLLISLIDLFSYFVLIVTICCGGILSEGSFFYFFYLRKFLTSFLRSS